MREGAGPGGDRGAAPPSWVLLALAFGAVYLVWGSTYLAIRFVVETLPPFSAAGVRFLVAGGVLYGWARAKGAKAPLPRQWRDAAIVGGLMLVTGNGMVVWAEQYVPSGLTALLIASVPLWAALLDWVRPGGARPGNRTAAGLLVGFLGVGLLMAPRAVGRGDPISVPGTVALLLASLSWAVGGLWSRRAHLPASPFLSSGLQMLAAGAALAGLGAATGEWGRFHPSAFSARSVLALAYLIVFGSLVGYTAYVWLLRVVHPARASTFAYAHPVVAVFLGWAIAGEPLRLPTVLAMAVIVVAVVLVNTGREEGQSPGGRQASR